tara:strand:+ start:182 stop:550 length:369 start_codon:yes stop_codon:yes gene_type:complete
MKDRRTRRLERIARRVERTARRKQINTNPIYTMEKKADVVIGKSENIVNEISEKTLKRINDEVDEIQDFDENDELNNLSTDSELTEGDDYLDDIDISSDVSEGWGGCIFWIVIGVIFFYIFF